MSKGVVIMSSDTLSSKRYEVIKMIDRFGAITTAQLEAFLSGIHFNTIYRARQQGITLGYVHERVYGMRRLTAITDRGARLIGKNVKGVALTNDDMYHQLISNQVLLAFLADYRDKRGYEVTFDTERDIIHDLQLSLPLSELKKPNRVRNLSKEIPDFILRIDGNVIAVEVELSRKTNNRIEDKLRKYKANKEYTSVFYICGTSYIRNSVQKINDYLNAGINFLMLEDVIDVEGV